MSDYKKIAEEALKRAKGIKVVNVINESKFYGENTTERMHPQLENELATGKHSLGSKHPVFPIDGDVSFEEKILSSRFKDVSKRYKKAFDVDTIDKNEVKRDMMSSVRTTMELEHPFKKELEKLAVDMIRKEYNMGEDVVEIHAELTPNIDATGVVEGKDRKIKPIEFKNHNEMVNANDEIYKRRFVNAMIQGAAKKCNHMFHMVDDELINLDPRLPNNYAKMMSAADYMYFIIPNIEEGIKGGLVRVEFPTKLNPKSVIHVQAMVFPVLIHELVKGVMEILSAHGLPKDNKISNYVIDKADFLSAEPWDMRLGPAIWENFTQMIDADDFDLKHHIFSELVSLPVLEFNSKMREIMAGTKEGKKIISDISDNVKADMETDDFNETMNEISNGGDLPENGISFNLDELIGDSTKNDNNNNTDDDNDDNTFNLDELF